MTTADTPDFDVQKPQLLVVDDRRNMVRLMAKVMGDDAVVHTAVSGREALEILGKQPLHAVLCDLKMPDLDGLDVLRACRKLQPQAQFVLMTAYATVGTAIEALKLGAYDYLTKPFEPDAARALLLRALARASVADVGADEVLPGLLARSPAMIELADLVRRIADSSATTLVLGETGTGKERVARAVHSLSPRAGNRFVALNCAAVPADLLESELFGHAKGAFTGATSERKGLFEAADGGSLFLDEIGDMRLSLQAKLTRVLEERVVRRVGETQERPVDFRLIAATHRDLQAMVDDGTFRQDLWYRLNVALVRLPPLRERQEDIELLARYFVGEASERNRGRLAREISPTALERLRQYPWPGNVRQLRAAIERACVVAKTSQVQVGDLPPELQTTEVGNTSDLVEGTWAEALDRGRADYGKRYLVALMQKFNGKVAAAARHAGVERESFYRLLRKYAVDPSDYRG